MRQAWESVVCRTVSVPARGVRCFKHLVPSEQRRVPPTGSLMPCLRECVACSSNRTSASPSSERLGVSGLEQSVSLTPVGWRPQLV